MSGAMIPIPRVPVSVRAATTADLPFIDSLQKRHTRMVGWMPTKQLEGKIAAGQVIVAEAMEKDEGGRMKDEGNAGDMSSPFSSFSPHPSSLRPVGYCIGHDQYFKRDDVGIIYQMNVAPGRQRAFVGATLLKAMFDRAAYGCRLFCCWCAQDIEANRFWESMGFVPLAFRAGSETKSRVHIFWQKRIRGGDTTTPWWFPSQTSAGSIREDRLVLPIPPGTHWSDAKPIILPQGELSVASCPLPVAEKKRRPARSSPATRNSQLATSARTRQAVTVSSGLRFQVANDSVTAKKPEAKPREPKRKRKNDPKYVAAARELRDRYLEHVNANGAALPSQAKYDVTKELGAPTVQVVATIPALSGPIAA